jgi:hypothetical protein
MSNPMSISRWRVSAFVLTLIVVPPLAAQESTKPAATVARFVVKDARQAVAVDATAFYAIDNRVIAKFDKKTGAQLARWEGEKDGPIIHMDSGAVLDGKLYTAHSNYPSWPMTSSIEVWDTATLKHLQSYSFGIDRGSLTWIDRDASGTWWGAFANYNRVFDKSPVAYGNKYNTQVVRFTSDWHVAEAWVLPDKLVEKFGDMSNSGGSWGPDGKLYITGHDNTELYVMELPKMGSVLRWIGTIPVNLAGQGIAFDRSDSGVLYGIIRRSGADSEVTASRIPLRLP